MIIANANEPEKYRKIADEVDNITIDYLVIGDVAKYCIERKTLDDLVKSVNDGRLWEQLKVLSELRKEGYRPILLIEGELWKMFKMKRLTLKKWHSFQVAIASFGVPIVMISGYNQFSLIMSIINEKCGKKTEYKRPTIRKPERTIEEERIDMISAVSGIGSKKAETLVKEFKTIDKLCDTSLEALESILGSKTALHLMEVLRGD